LTDELPDFLNPQLSFWSLRCSGRDYIEEVNPHTSPGRMEAFCPHEGISYNVSLADLVDASAECLAWAKAFVIGNEPDPPSADGISPEEHPLYEAWLSACAEYRATGFWPQDAPSLRNS
jgi:hypothetical protein